ncbi:MAG: 30S ribosomal protein S4 [Gemmatales bacterium]
MGRYTGPQGKINRRLGMVVFAKKGAVRAFERRPAAPGMHAVRGKLSNYGHALREKQKIKYFYGMWERQLRRFFEMAARKPGDTGKELLVYCERRLDNAICSAGVTLTRPQARQGVSHGHFYVNGRRVNIPSYLVKVGDVISVKPQPPLEELYRAIASSHSVQPPSWLEVNQTKQTITILRLPGSDEAQLQVDMQAVIEFLSR